jgi:hypothetical protein
LAHVEDPAPDPERLAPPPAERDTSATADARIAAAAAQGRAAPGGAGHPPAIRAGMETLQRTVGNRATAAMVAGRRLILQRLVDKRYAGLDPVAAVRKALADDNESDAHELMRRLTKEQADEVLGKFQKLATSCFGNETMGTAAQILVSKGASLRDALAWMEDEGTNWRLLSRVVASASPEEKLKIKGDAWLRWWVRMLGNTEMAALVKLLPLDLTTKLRWMREEGSDWGLMRDVIQSVPPPERTKVVEDAGLRAFFVSECGDSQMYEAVKLLGGRLSKQLAWMADEGCEDDWIKERIGAIADANERLGIYFEDLAWRRIIKMGHKSRVDIAKLLGGTPDQQMALLQNDVPIEWLSWATPSDDWVKAMVKYRKSPLDMLQVATKDPVAWGPVIRPHLWDLFKDFHNVIHPEYRTTAFWEAFGDGLAFNSGQIMHFIAALTGKRPAAGGKMVAGDQFKTVEPNDDTAREFMEILKPSAAGSSGALGISREEVAQGNLAFCDQEKDSSGVWQPISTSYFADPWIIIRMMSAAGDRDTAGIAMVGATPRTVGSGMTFFQNHVRHEIGHAVGARKIGGMKETGNAFAEDYASWKKSSKANFEAALWSDVPKPAAGWPSVPIRTANVTVTNKDVHDWCMDVMAKGSQPNNPLGNAAGDLQEKLAAVQASLWGGVKLVKYMRAIRAVDTKSMRDSAFRFSGFVPTDPVQIFATRWDDSFVQYDRAAHDAFQGISWYALSSPAEMFAEMYTARYAKKVLPVRVGTRDPLIFFRTLESQRDTMFGRKA